MKKTFIIVMLVLLPTAIFSASSGWYTFGTGYETRSGGTAESFDAAGVTLTSYDFWSHGAPGVFSGVNFNFPTEGGSATYSGKINVIVGPAVILRLGPSLILGGSVGTAISQTFIKNSNYTKHWVNLGIGVDFSLLFAMNENLGFVVGYMGAYNLWQYMKVESLFVNTEDLASGFFGIDSRPYIGLAVKTNRGYL